MNFIIPISIDRPLFINGCLAFHSMFIASVLHATYHYCFLRQAVQDFFKTQGYMFQFSTTEEGHLENMVAAHPQSVQYFEKWPHVLCWDTTFRISVFDFNLLQITGITPSLKTFTVAWAYMTSKTAAAFTSVCKMLMQTVFARKVPGICITDCELALVNSLTATLTNDTECTSVLLCTWHVDKNVQARLRPHFPNDSNGDVQFESCIADWRRVRCATTEAAYTEAWESFQNKWTTTHGSSVAYIKKTWIDPHKHRIIVAFHPLDKPLFMDPFAVTTQRVESQHAAVSRFPL